MSEAFFAWFSGGAREKCREHEQREGGDGGHARSCREKPTAAKSTARFCGVRLGIGKFRDDAALQIGGRRGAAKLLAQSFELALGNL